MLMEAVENDQKLLSSPIEMALNPCYCNTSDAKFFHRLLLHFSEKEYVLSSGWKSGTAMGIFGSCLIVFLICIVHEALEGLRYFLAKDHSICFQDKNPNLSRRSSLASIKKFGDILRRIKNAFTGYRITQSLLYGVHTLVGYLLILIVVTFNVWLIMAVILGKAVGYFMFTGSPTVEKTMRVQDGEYELPARPNRHSGLY